jgi:chromatin segregation and condensation protein Rec8/ScpA/Scc1 (kleisin family)
VNFLPRPKKYFTPEEKRAAKNRDRRNCYWRSAARRKRQREYDLNGKLGTTDLPNASSTHRQDLEKELELEKKRLGLSEYFKLCERVTE